MIKGLSRSLADRLRRRSGRVSARTAQIPKLIARPSSPARYRPAAMSLRACSGVIPNCRVSHPCRVVPAAVPGGRREGRQALLAGRFLCSSATARQPDPSTRLGPTAGCGRRGHVCGAARSCRRPGSPGAVLTRRGRSRRGGGGVPGRRWTGPRTPTHARSRLARAAPSTAGGRSRPRSSPRWAATVAYGHTVRRLAQPQAHDTKPRSTGPGQCSPRHASACLPRLIPEQARTRQDGLGY